MDENAIADLMHLRLGLLVFTCVRAGAVPTLLVILGFMRESPDHNRETHGISLYTCSSSKL